MLKTLQNIARKQWAIPIALSQRSQGRQFQSTEMPFRLVHQVSQLRSFSSAKIEDKDHFMEQLLSMTSEEVQSKCEEMGLPVVDSKATNIQTIKKHMKEQTSVTEEDDLMADLDSILEMDGVEVLGEEFSMSEGESDGEMLDLNQILEMSDGENQEEVTGFIRDILGEENKEESKVKDEQVLEGVSTDDILKFAQTESQRVAQEKKVKEQVQEKNVEDLLNLLDSEPKKEFIEPEPKTVVQQDLKNILNKKQEKKQVKQKRWKPWQRREMKSRRNSSENLINKFSLLTFQDLNRKLPEDAEVYSLSLADHLNNFESDAQVELMPEMKRRNLIHSQEEMEQIVKKNFKNDLLKELPRELYPNLYKILALDPSKIRAPDCLFKNSLQELNTVKHAMTPKQLETRLSELVQTYRPQITEQRSFEDPETLRNFIRVFAHTLAQFKHDKSAVKRVIETFSPQLMTIAQLETMSHFRPNLFGTAEKIQKLLDSYLKCLLGSCETNLLFKTMQKSSLSKDSLSPDLSKQMSQKIQVDTREMIQANTNAVLQNKKILEELTLGELMAIMRSINILPLKEPKVSQLQKQRLEFLADEALTKALSSLEVSKPTQSQLQEIGEIVKQFPMNLKLQNKFDQAVMQVNPLEYNIMDLLSLSRVTGNPQKQQPKKIFQSAGRIPQEVFIHKIPLRASYSFNQLESTDDVRELLKYYEEVIQKNPPREGRFHISMLNSGINLTRYLQSHPVPLDLGIELASHFVSNTIKPTLLFPEILKMKKDQSFAKVVPDSTLLKFVSLIADRAQQDSIIFEHLRMSTSKIHAEFKPYNEITFKMLYAIEKDLRSEKQLTLGQKQILNKIFSAENLFKNYFRNTQEMANTCTYLLENSLTQPTGQWVDWVDCLYHVSSVSHECHKHNPNLLPMIQKSLEEGLVSLKKEMIEPNNLTVSDLVKLNQKILWIMEDQGKVVSQYRNSPLLHLSEAVFKAFIIPLFKKNYRSKNLFLKIDTAEGRAMWNSKFEATNSTQVFKDIGPLIDIMRQKIQTQSSKVTFQNSLGFLRVIPNIRSLKERDLSTFFKFLDEVAEHSTKFSDKPGKSEMGKLQAEKTHYQNFRDASDKLIMYAASNLETLIPTKFQTFKKSDSQQRFEFVDQGIHALNENLKIEASSANRNIINLYKNAFTEGCEYFEQSRKMQFNLTSLSILMAQELDRYQDQDIFTFLKMISSDQIQDYSHEFLHTLHQKYQTDDSIRQLRQKGDEFFLDFAENWPFFLHNQRLIQELVNMSDTANVQQQSKILKILAIHKNVVHPQQLQQHFYKFIQLKSKNEVKPIITSFIQTCAYVGHSEDFDMRALCTVFRRIFKNPEEAELSTLLDLMMLLALSSDSHDNFDPKTKFFIEDTLSYIDDQFKGYLTTEPMLAANNQKTALNYYKSFESKRNFNKAMIKKQLPQMDYIKQFLVDPQSSSELFKGYNKRSAMEEYFTDQSQIDIVTETSEDSEEELKFLNDNFDEMDEIEIEQPVEAEEEADVFEEAEQEETQNILMPQRKQTYKSYEFKSKEGLITEEQALQKKSKQIMMDKKQQHLYLFTNYDQLNMVNVNKNDIVKAWAILFHFKSKGRDTLLFEEFNSIITRNTSSKCQDHDLFHEYFRLLVEQSHQKHFTLKQNRKCNRTGWPIDIHLQAQSGRSLFEEEAAKINSAFGGPKRMAVYFFLQEEMCFNLLTGKEEPLAIQKLMMKHVKNMNNMPVTYIGESMFRQMSEQAKERQSTEDKSLLELRKQLTDLLQA